MRAITSASNIFRRKACPSSAHWESKYDQADSEDSVEGQLLHANFLTAEKATWLTPVQLEALVFADTLADEGIGRFCEQIGIADNFAFTEHHEIPLMIYGKNRGELMPGHADYIRNWNGARIIIDAKFGWLDVEHAADNLQLASYALGAYDREPKEFTGVLIVQPRNFGPKFSEAVYLASSMPGIRGEIENIIDVADHAGANDLRTGQHCRYCRAKPVCPAYQAAMQIEPITRGFAIDTLSNDQLVDVFHAVKFAKDIEDEVKAQMRSRIQQGQLPGWKLKNNGANRKVTAPLSLYDALNQMCKTVGGVEIDMEEYDACRDMSFGALEELLAKTLGVSQNKASKLIKEYSGNFVRSIEKEKSPVQE